MAAKFLSSLIEGSIRITCMCHLSSPLVLFITDLSKRTLDQSVRLSLTLPSAGAPTITHASLDTEQVPSAHTSLWRLSGKSTPDFQPPRRSWHLILLRPSSITKKPSKKVFSRFCQRWVSPFYPVIKALKFSRFSGLQMT